LHDYRSVNYSAKSQETAAFSACAVMYRTVPFAEPDYALIAGDLIAGY